MVAFGLWRCFEEIMVSPLGHGVMSKVDVSEIVSTWNIVRNRMLLRDFKFIMALIEPIDRP